MCVGVWPAGHGRRAEVGSVGDAGRARRADDGTRPHLAHLHVGRIDPRYVRSPSIARSRNAVTFSSISAHNCGTSILEIPLMPIAFTGASTLRVDTPWTYAY